MTRAPLICALNEEHSVCYLYEECAHSMYALFCTAGILSCCLLKLYYAGATRTWPIFFCNGKIVFINFTKLLDIDQINLTQSGISQ